MDYFWKKETKEKNNFKKSVKQTKPKQPQPNPTTQPSQNNNNKKAKPQNRDLGVEL